MSKEEDINRSTNTKFLIIYFTILLTAQAAGILLFLKFPSFLLGAILGLSFGFFLPIGLAFLLIRILDPRSD
jgi:cyanate permease